MKQKYVGFLDRRVKQLYLQQDRKVKDREGEGERNRDRKTTERRERGQALPISEVEEGIPLKSPQISQG